MEEVERNAESTALAHANNIRAVIASVEKIATNAARIIENSHLNKQQIDVMLQSQVKYNPEIYGSVVAYEPYVMDSSVGLFCPYYYKQGERLLSARLDDPSYNYPTKDWYKLTKETEVNNWSEPYFDEGGGNILMSTFSAPFFKTINGERRFAGVVTCDIPLSWLEQTVSSIKVYQTGYAFLVSRKGLLIAHPDTTLFKRNIFEIARERNNPVLTALGKKMINGEKGMAPYTSSFNHKVGFLNYVPVGTNTWTLCVFFPEDEFLANLNKLNFSILILAAISFLVILLVIVRIVHSIVKPLKAVTGTAEAIAQGDISNGSVNYAGFLEKNKSIFKIIDNEKNNPDSKRKTKNEAIRLLIAISSMIESIKALITQMQKSGVQVASSANEITASAKEMEATATEQFAASKEVTATSKEITNTSEKLYGTVTYLSESLTISAEMAVRGKTILSNLDSAIKQLNNSTNSIFGKLSLINDKSEKISGVIIAINKISDQTNLLSLNAAIEAEKAGEYAKGFTIIAQEISRLAEQAAQSAHDIDKMVKEMQSSVSSGVMEMEKFAADVRQQAKEVDSASSQLSMIIEQVNLLNPQFDEVKRGMQLQSNNSKQINEAMEQLTQSAEQTKDALSEFVSAASQLNSTVKGLQTEVLKFKMN
jgi:methyl-accepting chemotaxis protein